MQIRVWLPDEGLGRELHKLVQEAVPLVLDVMEHETQQIVHFRLLDIPFPAGGKVRVPSTSFVTGRGQRASTTVPRPPRGRNSPRTVAHIGCAALTTSSSTRLTTFS